MHQKKSEIQIGKESFFGLSSHFKPNPPSLFSSIHQKQLQFQTQYNKTNFTPTKTQSESRNHLEVQIAPLSCLLYPSSTTLTPTDQTKSQTRFQNEPICNNPSTSKTLLSAPHKRSIMSQASPKLSHSPTLSSIHHHHTTVLNSEYSEPSSFPCCSSFAVLLATKTIALKLIWRSCRVHWLRVHLRFFILLSLPSLYFLTSNHHRAFFLHFLCVIAFSAVLVVSLNLALPRLPSIRLFLARSLPIKLSSSNNAASKPPVVWSIGSKPKSEKRPNSGSWVHAFSNGDVYEGEFHKGKCSGSGVYYYNMCGKYEGDWVDEKYDGHGVETWAKGSRYRGQYRQGLRHGFGVYRFYTGDVYAGEWCNGQCHGCGIHTCEDGSRYVGEFKWGVKHGLGHYQFRNGDTYAGEYFADKIHGFGVYRFGNGQKYEGAWHEGRRQGLGMYTFRNGEMHSGHWQNGVLNVSSTRDVLPGSSFTIDHSKVMNAVQEAQGAAERAIDVAKVDERVNKAVAAANKAANAARVAAVKAVQNRMRRIDEEPIPNI